MINIKDLKFMSLGGNCLNLRLLMDESSRIKGPVDNMYMSKGLYTIKYILEGDLLKEIESQNFETFKNEWDPKYEIAYRYKKSGIQIHHNDPTTEKYLIEFQNRCKNLQRMLEENNSGHFFLYAFTLADTIDCKGETLSPQFYEGLEYLKNKGLLNKIIFVHYVSATEEYWKNFSMKNLIIPDNLEIMYFKLKDFSNDCLDHKHFKTAICNFLQRSKYKISLTKTEELQAPKDFQSWIESVFSKNNLTLKEKLSDFDRLVLLKNYELLPLEHSFAKSFEDFLKRYEDSESIDYIVNWADLQNSFYKKSFYKAAENYKEDIDYFGYELSVEKEVCLKYILRGIEKYMPWIGVLHLIVPETFQVPEWVDQKKLHIVSYDSFIPKNFLPTFNNFVVETFLYRIPGLSEKFIYGSPNIFSIGEMYPEDFFEKDAPIRKCFYGLTRVAKDMYMNEIYQLNVAEEATKLKYPSQKDVFPTIYSVPASFTKTFYKDTYNSYRNYIDYELSTFKKKEKGLGQLFFTYIGLLKKCFKETERGIKTCTVYNLNYKTDFAKKTAEALHISKLLGNYYQIICIKSFYFQKPYKTLFKFFEEFEEYFLTKSIFEKEGECENE